jgi:hypothetical protein
MTEPWDRLPDETELAFRAFIVYRDMGMGRSIEKLRDLILDPSGRPRYKTTRYMQEWSRLNRWVERARAYDDHLDQIRLKAADDEIRKSKAEMRKRHTTIALAMQDRVIAKIMPDPKNRDTYLDPKEIKAGQIPMWAKISTDLERTTMDMPTVIFSNTGESKVDKYSEAKWLDEYDKLMAEYGLTDGRTKKEPSEGRPSEDDEVHPDNPDA